MTGSVHPVILCGGSGTRLWPVSRALHPKQLLALAGPGTMLQETARRAAGEGFAAPLMVCNAEHRFLVAEQLREAGITPRAIVLEPVGRNTAPAVAMAALLLTRDDPDAVMAVLPSDHVVADPAAFRAAVAVAAAAARAGHLATFGIRPDHPATGYGYIRQGAAVEGLAGCHRVDSFIEKPDAATAAGFLASGGYLWNSGMFVLHAATYLDELERFEPEMARACRETIAEAVPDLDFLRLPAAAFAAIRSRSIDYAVMEKTDRAVVVPVDMGWSDLGSWRALWDIGAKDEGGNVVRGDVLEEGARGCYLHSEGPLVAAVGVSDVVVVATPDAVLVAGKDRAEEVKTIVERLGDHDRPQRNSHLRVHRPWGSYQTIDVGDRFQVKRIIVKPGARLSLQMHHHRAEHWVVVSGTAKVTRGRETILLHENQSTYIPIGEVHRLENPGKVPLHLIEVQSGCYLGEDDIVRIEDGYGRA